MKRHNPIDDALDELLKRRVRDTSAASGGAVSGRALCGDPELLAAYAEQSLDAAARDEFQVHLAACAACRKAVVQLVRLTPREAVADTAPAKSATAKGATAWWRGLLWAAPVLASVVFVGSIIVLRLQPAPTPSAELTHPREKVEIPVAQIPAAEARDQAPAAPAIAATTPTTSSRARNVAPGGVAETQAARTADVDAVTLSKETLRKESSGFAPAPPPSVAAGAAGGAAAASAPAASPAPLPKAEEISKAKLDEKNQSKDQNKLSTAQTIVVESASSQIVATQNFQQNATNAPSPSAENNYVMQQLPARGRMAARLDQKAPAATCSIVKGMLFLTIGSGSPLDLKTPEEVTSCKFTDALNGEVHGKSGRDYRTKDGGKTWLDVPPVPLPAPKN